METASLTFAVWPTGWGPIGAVAGPNGLKRLVLPFYSTGDLRDLLVFEHAGAVEDAAAFAALIARTQEYFSGRPAAFDDIPCDLPRTASFSAKVLAICRTIPYGQTLSYSQLAFKAGNADGARAAAAALGRNPIPLVIPCHRVTYAGGRLGGFSAPGGEALKRRMIELEAGKR